MSIKSTWDKEDNTASAHEAFSEVMEPDILYTVNLIRQLHSGQKDQSGKPYADHPVRVARNLLRIFPDASKDMVKAALLHDTMEDCGISEDFLRTKGYSQGCIEMVKLVSKPSNDAREYAKVIDDLVASGNEGAMKIKIADNAENLHPERAEAFKRINPEKADRLQSRYRSSLEKLCAATGADFNRILDMIKNSPSLDQHNLEVEPL